MLTPWPVWGSLVRCRCMVVTTVSATVLLGLGRIQINGSRLGKLAFPNLPWKEGKTEQWKNPPNQSISNTCTVRAPVFGRHQFFGTSEHYGKAHGSLSGWLNYNYTACCWFPTSSNILILPSQFWQIRFESYWLHCSKCRIVVLFNTVCDNKNYNDNHKNTNIAFIENIATAEVCTLQFQRNL